MIGDVICLHCGRALPEKTGLGVRVYVHQCEECDGQAEKLARMMAAEEYARQESDDHAELKRLGGLVSQLTLRIHHLKSFTEHKPGCPRRYRWTRRITGVCRCGLDLND